MVTTPHRYRVRELRDLREQLTRAVAAADEMGLAMVAIHITAALEALPPPYGEPDAGDTATQ